MSLSMRRDRWLGALIVLSFALVVFLAAVGLRPGELPFIPGARFSDAVTSHLPAAYYLREHVIIDESFPVWRDTIMVGQPFAANPLHKTAYPLQWLTLIIPVPVFLNMMIGLHMLLAGFGMWCWLRALGLTSGAALVGGAAWMVTPRMFAHLGAGHVDIVYAMAWLPWVMAGIYHVMSHDSTEKRQTRLAHVIGSGASIALMVIADVRVGLYGMGLAAAYAVYLAAVYAKALPRVGGLALALGIAAVLLIGLIVPLIGWSPYLSRAGLTQAEAGIFSLEPVHLLGVVLPVQRGNPETVTMLGVTGLVLAATGAFSAPRQRWFWLVVMVVAAWFAFGVNSLLWTTLTNLSPALLWFRVPARAWIIVALVTCVLAGYGAAWITQRARGSSRRVVGAFLIVVIVCEAIAVGRGWVEWRGGDNWFEPYVPLAERLIALEPGRIYAPAYSLPQSVAELYGLRLFGGVDPFQVQAVTAAINAAGGIDASGYSIVVPPLNGANGDDLSGVNQGAVPDSSALAAWGVTHVIAPYEIVQERLVQVDQVGDEIIYRIYGSHTTARDDIPNWAGVQVPDSDTVSSLNEQTVNAQLFSLSAFAGIGIFAVLWHMTRKRM